MMPKQYAGGQGIFACSDKDCLQQIAQQPSCGTCIAIPGEPTSILPVIKCMSLMQVCLDIKCSSPYDQIAVPRLQMLAWHEHDLQISHMTDLSTA